MITVYLVDGGQDFLEWDIEDGEVTGCRPFQGWLWIGTKVHNTDISQAISWRLHAGTESERR